MIRFTYPSREPETRGWDYFCWAWPEERDRNLWYLIWTVPVWLSALFIWGIPEVQDIGYFFALSYVWISYTAMARGYRAGARAAVRCLALFFIAASLIPLGFDTHDVWTWGHVFTRVWELVRAL